MEHALELLFLTLAFVEGNPMRFLLTAELVHVHSSSRSRRVISSEEMPRLRRVNHAISGAQRLVGSSLLMMVVAIVGLGHRLVAARAAGRTHYDSAILAIWRLVAERARTSFHLCAAGQQLALLLAG